jgi:hypothetical protein
MYTLASTVMGVYSRAMTAINAHRATPYPYYQQGYAAGTFDEGSKWFTVWGSAYDSRLVYATAAEADQRANVLRSKTIEPYRSAITVRQVCRVPHAGVSVNGEAYAIIPEEDNRS